MDPKNNLFIPGGLFVGIGVGIANGEYCSGTND
jgi:hypothetical protein